MLNIQFIRGIKRIATPCNTSASFHAFGSVKSESILQPCKKVRAKFGKQSRTQANTAKNLCPVFAPTCPVSKSRFSLVILIHFTGLDVWYIRYDRSVTSKCWKRELDSLAHCNPWPFGYLWLFHVFVLRFISKVLV